jgi:carbamoyl-phosphate synthase large subunit
MPDSSEVHKVIDIMFLIGSVCGDIGQAVCSILSTNVADFSLLAFDQNPNLDYGFESIIRSPSCDSVEFQFWLKMLISQNSISHYIPCSEYEMRVIPIDIQANKPIKVVWAGRQIFELFDDKLSGSEFLERHGFDIPILIDVKSLGLNPFVPCVVKPRRSSGSRGVVVCETKEQLQQALAEIPSSIIQEYIPYEDNEFTVGVYRSEYGVVRTIVFRRILDGGRTKQATVVHDEDITRECSRLADILELNGSINVQIRKYNGKNYIFEVNPRFSSTLQGRHLLGFKDLLWSLGLEDIPLQEVFDGHVGVTIIRGNKGKFYLNE